MKKLIALFAIGATLTGCQMTPEQRANLANALAQMGRQMQAQSQYQAQQANYWYQQSQNQIQQYQQHQQQLEMQNKLNEINYNIMHNCNGMIGDGVGGTPDC